LRRNGKDTIIGFVEGRMGCFVFCYGWQSGQEDLLVIAFIWNDSKWLFGNKLW